MNDDSKPRYKVRKCRINQYNDLYGKSHRSKDLKTTLCNINMNNNWFITDNDSNGKITCNKCRKIVEQNLVCIQTLKCIFKKKTNNKITCDAPKSIKCEFNKEL